MADITHLSKSVGSTPATEDNPLSVGTGARLVAYKTLSIPINTAISSLLVVPDHWRVSKITTLASWIAASLLVQSSDDNGATWGYVYQYGLIPKIAVKEGCINHISPDMQESQWISHPLIRFVSGTASGGVPTAVNQTTAQTIVIELTSF